MSAFSSAPTVPPSIPPAVARKAVEWLVALQSGGSAQETQLAFQHWLRQHPDHARAWDHIESVNARMQGLAAPIAARTALTVPASGSQVANRRQAIKALTVVLFAGGATWAAQSHLPWRRWSADVQTAVGERRTLTLDDGTRVALNTDSAVNLRFNAAERRLQLVMGEILVTTAPDPLQPARPFVVATAQGEVRPVGTRFALRQLGEACQVDVFDGAVQIHPVAALQSLQLQAGQRARFTETRIDAITATRESDTAWSQGMIVANGTHLADFLAELERYRRGQILCDAAVAGLRVSGTFPLQNTDRVLEALGATLPVTVEYSTRFWVRVRPARQTA